MWSEEILNQMLTEPSEALITDMKKIQGDILILGAGGKMGPSLALLAKNAVKKAGIQKEIFAVSRFSDKETAQALRNQGVRIISSDLLEEGALDAIPDVENVIFMAGRKFGTDGQEPFTWAMNAWLPSLVAERFKRSKIVVFSSGNIYPIVPSYSGGCVEETKLNPTGEYPQSCLARERCFQYGALRYGTEVLIYRLNYAIALTYGVLYDIASKVWKEEVIHLSNASFNCIWQGDANEIAIRSLLHTQSPANILNVTGPETISVRYVAEEFARIFHKKCFLEGTESNDSFLSNTTKMSSLFGYPKISLGQMIQWQAEWIMEGGKSMNKPTHFEERKGIY